MNVLLYNGPLLYDCNVPIEVLMCVEDGKCSVKVLSPFQFCVQQWKLHIYHVIWHRFERFCYNIENKQVLYDSSDIVRYVFQM